MLPRPWKTWLKTQLPRRKTPRSKLRSSAYRKGVPRGALSFCRRLGHSAGIPGGPREAAERQLQIRCDPLNLIRLTPAEGGSGPIPAIPSSPGQRPMEYEMADIPARTELKVTTGPIRGSRKIHVE